MGKRRIKTPVPNQFGRDLIKAVLEGRVGSDAYRYALRATGRVVSPSYPDMNLSARIRFLKEKFELDPDPIKKLLPISIRRQIRTSDDLEEFIRGRKREVKKIGERRKAQQKRLRSHLAVRALSSMGIEIKTQSQLRKRLRDYRSAFRAIFTDQLPDSNTLREVRRFLQKIALS